MRYFSNSAHVVLSCMVLMLVMLACIQSAQAQKDRVRWGVPIAFASNLTALGDTLPWVVERLETMSDGDIRLRVFEPNKIVPSLGIFEAVSEGKIEAGYSWMGYEIGTVPASALYGATPFGLEPPEFIAWYYHHGGKDLLQEIYAPHNVKPVLCGTISPEAFGWINFEITDVSQLEGLKFRASGLGGKVMEEVGASVSVIPGADLFQALEQGVIDGMEFSLPTVDEQMGFWKVAKYYHLPGWHQPATNQFLYINLDAWDEVRPDHQLMIETACMAGVTWALSKAEALQGAVLARFREEGVKAVRLPEDVLRRFEVATEAVLAREAEKDADFARVLASMRAFQAEHGAWKRLGYLPRDWHGDWHGSADEAPANE